MRADCKDTRRKRRASFSRQARWSVAYAALFIVRFLSTADAQADSVRILYVLEAGTYKAETANNVPTAGTTGLVNFVRKVELLERTTNVAARRGARFGLRYLVEGLPGTAVDITFVLRFPPSGLRDPVTGQRHWRNTHSKSVPVGIPLYREYQLEHDWEVVPGIWRFEFWHAGLKFGEQAFCLYSVPDSNDGGGSIVHDQECANDLVS
ncbi:uncharacterized protein DUF3859 [Pseudorhodoplanes sinuspersici]|uniref:Uncharacterized protein n=1 Tax=Pseudorhodoplanes sinuspersici TaxID=1235591 RepID=A0A1W6ZKX6_9HYPH|nr:hypothetical protein CAK95_02450 [Pseudorhodoplanes sinuspersici]RKE68180.1 uncharacterized protein DUF3859 [Pseudorhodoplanes sinuspersici]